MAAETWDRMRRSPGSVTSSHKHTPNFYSENSNSSHSATTGDSDGRRSAGPLLVETEGTRARGSTCGEPALSPGVLEEDTRAGSSRPKPAPRYHGGPTACGAATGRGEASGAGGVDPGDERAGRARGAGPGAGLAAVPSSLLRGRARHVPEGRGRGQATAGTGRGGGNL